MAKFSAMARQFRRSLVPLVGGVLALVAGLATALVLYPASGASPTGGSVDVLYAGSLVTVMQAHLDSAFQQASGYTVNGVAGGSKELASEIKAGTQQADVFISASPAVNASLMGPANGRWVSWYASFARSPLLLAYNPKSSFAHELESKPWYDVIGQSGFLLGRTDPATDPKGALTVQALKEAARTYHRPALTGIANSSNGEFPEQALVGELQAGQLDAGFFYGVEASAAHLATVPLRGIGTLTATYTVTIAKRAPHAAAARAFLAFLLRRKARAILVANGMQPVSPTEVKGVPPANLNGAIPSR